ncbi:MAG: TonB-dependent receptor domain-containing protein [Rhodanobacteraceae bacterium]
MNRKLLASAICAGLFVAGTAYAQDNPAPTPQQQQPETQPQPQPQPPTTEDQTTPEFQSQAKKEDVKTLEGVVVSGSLLKRPEYQTVVPVQEVNIKADQAAGSFGVANLLQSTAVAAGAVQINNQFSGFIVEGGTGVQPIDLRGLGPSRTLVLLDGQRPGPAGTRGQVAAFDLNVIPEVILQRIEIVKDGSSSIYGSDAISGVVNLITKKKMDHLELTSGLFVPQGGGGEQVSASIGDGWNFSNGNIMVAAQFQEQFPLPYRDRDFLKCSHDLVWGDGKRIDRQDRSILEGTKLANCPGNLYADTIIKYFDANTRYVPSRDGSTVGPFAGFHPRPYDKNWKAEGRYSPYPNYRDDGVAYYEDVLNFPFYADKWAVNKNRNSSFYASSLFTFGSVNWTNQFLYNHRQTNTKSWRQFFPVVYNPADDDYYEPIMPYPSNDKVTVDYYYLRSQLDGGFGDSSWTWQVNATHSRSKGTYGHLGIDARVSGDLTKPANELDLPPIDYFDPCVLNGQCMDRLTAAVGLQTRGSTVFEQSGINAVVTGDLFELPAGPVSAAFGVEYRHSKIDDEPDPNNAAGFEWGYSSSQTTKGSDNVKEAFGEIGIPIIKGVTGFENLSADLSAREFKYASVGSTDRVWKYGLNWQITSTWRVRGTIGTSYRAPGLYQLYLGNQSGFYGQTGIDPCIDWGQSNNDFIRANCAAAGIPSDYAASGNGSATVFQGGGKGFLKPETSRAKTLGVVWTPAFGNFNLALDYFDYHIRGEIDTLGPADITFGCYGRPVYPNSFCNLFHRNSPTDAGHPNMITDIHATYININSERARGYDLQMNYSDDFSFGKLSADLQVTYTKEDIQQLFDSSEASGFNTSNFVGYIGRPTVVGVGNISVKRGDWTYYVQEHYTSSTHNKDIGPYFTYQGYPDAYRQISAKYQFRTDMSVGYDNGKWGVLAGIRNVFDATPPLISDGVNTRRGDVPLVASQYDWFGRTFFARMNYNF